MNKVLLACSLGLVLAGCNATIQSRPTVIDLETQPSQRLVVPEVYTLPPPRPYVERRNHCYTMWENTPRGYVERRVCGNHIP